MVAWDVQEWADQVALAARSRKPYPRLRNKPLPEFDLREGAFSIKASHDEMSVLQLLSLYLHRTTSTLGGMYCLD